MQTSVLSRSDSQRTARYGHDSHRGDFHSEQKPPEAGTNRLAGSGRPERIGRGRRGWNAIDLQTKEQLSKRGLGQRDCQRTPRRKWQQLATLFEWPNRL
jgi:hypothetical protein